jgi:hypothetical protein
MIIPHHHYHDTISELTILQGSKRLHVSTLVPKTKMEYSPSEGLLLHTVGDCQATCKLSSRLAVATCMHLRAQLKCPAIHRRSDMGLSRYLLWQH